MSIQVKKIMVVGASGMLGSALVAYLAQVGHHVVAVQRRTDTMKVSEGNVDFITGIDISDQSRIAAVLKYSKPSVVVNAVGLVKQLAAGNEAVPAITVNSLFPHQLHAMCLALNARLIHVSTDCVFSGLCGNYNESSVPDAHDVYGRSKLLGEVTGTDSVTLRTSIIGHECHSTRGLLEWFLSQTGAIRGYRKAIFSGVPTNELARIIDKYVLTEPSIEGLFHVSAGAISKYELLNLIAREYSRVTRIEPCDDVVIDRSLDSTQFRTRTGYHPPSWERLIQEMREFGIRYGYVGAGI